MDEFPHRIHPRMKGYDYSQAGGYFVTIVTWNRFAFFGRIVNHGVDLSPSGKIAFDLWKEIPIHFPFVELDEFVVMPNHIHGILFIYDSSVGLMSLTESLETKRPLPAVGSTHESTLPRTIFPKGPKPQSLSAIIGLYKSAVSKQIHKISPGLPLWQRNYYDHIIRDDQELDRLRLYIQDNPRHWAEDEENQPS